METTRVFGKNNVSDIRLFESSANCIHSHAILVANKSKIINIITLSVNFMTAFFCCVKKKIFFIVKVSVSTVKACYFYYYY